MNRPEPGHAMSVGEGLRLVLAPNPGAMTYWGTNTFILGEGEVAIVDPGPDDAAHLDALMRATAGETVSHILITHAHADHSGLCRPLRQLTGAPVFAFGPPEAGRRTIMRDLARTGVAGGGEGVDHGFRPDATLSDGDRIDGAGWTVDVLHTPGHFAGHLAFDLGDTVLSGDHVMGWSSSLVSPPDGDISSFMATSHRLLGHASKRFFPAHGATLGDAGAQLSWLIEHRRDRETAILEALGPAPRTIPEIARAVYIDIPAPMLAAAERNVFAHLIDLTERKLAQAETELAASAVFTRV